MKVKPEKLSTDVSMNVRPLGGSLEFMIMNGTAVLLIREQS
jgi:hypothetical protein